MAYYVDEVRRLGELKTGAKVSHEEMIEAFRLHGAERRAQTIAQYEKDLNEDQDLGLDDLGRAIEHADLLGRMKDTHVALLKAKR